MKLFFKRNYNNLIADTGENWKVRNKKYLNAIEKFLDRASNIKDEELRNSMINNMLLCDKILTSTAKDMFVEYYKSGYKDGKRIN